MAHVMRLWSGESSIEMAFGGQATAHAPHAMHAASSCWGLPRYPSGKSSGAAG